VTGLTALAYDPSNFDMQVIAGGVIKRVVLTLKTVDSVDVQQIIIGTGESAASRTHTT
jgi:hypothetical protein